MHVHNFYSAIAKYRKPDLAKQSKFLAINYELRRFSVLLNTEKTAKVDPQ
jgi:hypothetical protein